MTRVLSLFAGIGGLDLGLEAHGCETVAYSEIDPYASQIMALRFPSAVNLGDITTIDWKVAGDEHGPFDIICGGFPCQDISLAGKGAGIAEGTRSGLWSCYADAIRELQPRGVLVENVAALLARGIDRVLGDLAACGFDAEWDCIPAASVGAPHLRDRVFIVAYRTDAAPDEIVAGNGSDADGERAERRGRTGIVASSSGASEANVEQWERDGDAALDICAASSDANCGRFEVSEECQRDSRRESGRLESAEQRHHADGLGGSDERRASTAHADEQRAQVPHQRRQPAVEQSRRESSAGGSWGAPAGSDWWRAEPGVGRVVDGVPKRVDRLRCLGNAVVPQVAEHVAGILMQRIEVAA